MESDVRAKNTFRSANMKPLFIMLLMIPGLCLADGWTNWAKPTQVDIDRGNGIMVYGNYGNPSECVAPKMIYIPSSHPAYEHVYEVVTKAFSNVREIRMYTNGCGTVNYYTSTEDYFNFAREGGVGIRH